LNTKLVGILISRKKYKAMKKGQTYRSHKIHEKAAKYYGFTICYFTLTHIKNKTNIKVLKKHHISNIYIEEIVGIPKVVCNRVTLRRKRTRKKLKFLIDSGSKVFNYIPFKNGKDRLNKLLENEPVLADHLPKTLTGSIQKLKMMMSQYESLVIKPVFSSLGKGIMFLEKQPGGSWILYDRREQIQKWREIHFTDEIPKIIENLFKKRSFIIQEKIPLASYYNRPFDLRVIVQKNSKGDWDITGLFPKVAPQRGIGQGEAVSKLEDFDSTIKANYLKIKKFSLKVAEVLETYYQHIGDLGLDIGLTDTGKLYFIECNFRGQYGSLRKYKKSLWEKIHFTLIGYSHYLLNINK
jgi:glutathione synthase/RimK-type ligase-like ATP-grasp enzyme